MFSFLSLISLQCAGYFIAVNAKVKNQIMQDSASKE